MNNFKLKSKDKIVHAIGNNIATLTSIKHKLEQSDIDNGCYELDFYKISELKPKDFTFYYAEVICLFSAFENNVESDWINNIDNDGQYSHGYFRAILKGF